jgi:hypothetical protein
MRQALKTCKDCGLRKPAAEFPRNRNYKDGRHPYCKPCHNARGRETKLRLYGSSRHYHLPQKYGMGADHVQRISTRKGDCVLSATAALPLRLITTTPRVRSEASCACIATPAWARFAMIRTSFPAQSSISKAPMSERRRCPACKETKQLTDFPRNRATKSGHAAYCKPCHNRISRANGKSTMARPVSSISCAGTTWTV